MYVQYDLEKRNIVHNIIHFEVIVILAQSCNDKLFYYDLWDKRLV